MRTGGVNDQSTDLPISSQPALPPESQPAVTHLTSDVWLKDKKMAIASLVRISLTYMSVLRFFMLSNNGDMISLRNEF